jgi:hypothetical protein
MGHAIPGLESGVSGVSAAGECSEAIFVYGEYNIPEIGLMRRRQPIKPMAMVRINCSEPWQTTR